MDVAKIAQEKLNSMVEDGTIDKLVTDQVTKAVTNIIGESFGQWGEWGKKLKEVINEKMQINLDTLSIPAYNAMLISTIESHLTDTIAANSIELLKGRIDSILKIPVKKEWKLSDICKMYWMENKQEDERLYLEVKESEYGSQWIHIGKEDTTNSYFTKNSNPRIEVTIGIDTKSKKVWVAKMGNVIGNPLKDKIYKGKFEATLMTLWTQECILDIDVEDADEIDIDYDNEQ